MSTSAEIKEVICFQFLTLFFNVTSEQQSCTYVRDGETGLGRVRGALAVSSYLHAGVII